jgi:hypothetical protein
MKCQRELTVQLEVHESFEDCGSQGRTCNIANHAHVLMILGLRRKWKQPVAYSFSSEISVVEINLQYLHEDHDVSELPLPVTSQGLQGLEIVGCYQKESTHQIF